MPKKPVGHHPRTQELLGQLVVSLRQLQAVQLIPVVLLPVTRL